MSDVIETAGNAIHRLRAKRFHLEDEKETQRQIACALEEAPAIAFEREVRVTGGIIDFLLAGGVGIEVKLKGGAGAIARQLHRYARDPAIFALVFVTAKPVAFDATIGGKPLYVLNLGRAWL